MHVWVCADVCKFIPVVISLSEAHIEFDKSHYFEPEGTIIRVCAVVIEPFIPCPIFFPFEINITTHDRDAGRLTVVEWKGYF